MPTTVQARRSETPNRSRSTLTALRRHCACGSGSEVSRRDLPQHVLVQLGVSQQTLQSGVLALELLEPFRVGGFHAAVLGQPPVPRRLGDLEMSAHLVELSARREELVALGELADDLIRRVPPALVRNHVVADSSCPETGHQETQNDWTTTEGSPHLTFGETSLTTPAMRFIVGIPNVMKVRRHEPVRSRRKSH